MLEIDSASKHNLKFCKNPMGSPFGFVQSRFLYSLDAKQNDLFL